MTENKLEKNDWQVNEEEISLFTLGTMLLHRWRIIMFGILAGGLIAVIPVISKPKLYSASASFIPKGGEGGRAGLANLAGQFGVALPSGSQAESPAFYSDLLKSRVLLRSIVLDSFVVKELSGKHASFMELFEIPGSSPASREEEAIKRLSGMIKISIVDATGVVELSISTEWPSLSLALATKLVDRVNEYNENVRRGQAATERKFVEERLAEANSELREAENRLADFLRRNRDVGTSPELIIERSRLQGNVSLRQQLVTSLMQAYEDARIREVRDTPVITVFETPYVSTKPAARGRLQRLFLGFIVGGVLAIVIVLILHGFASFRGSGSPSAQEFIAVVGQVKRDILSPRSWVRR